MNFKIREKRYSAFSEPCAGTASEGRRLGTLSTCIVPPTSRVPVELAQTIPTARNPATLVVQQFTYY